MDSTQVYTAIRHMTKKQLLRVMPLIGVEPRYMTAPVMRDVLRSRHQDGKVTGEFIVEQQQKYGALAKGDA